jgi:hypothetical protein
MQDQITKSREQALAAFVAKKAEIYLAAPNERVPRAIKAEIDLLETLI